MQFEKAYKEEYKIIGELDFLRWQSPLALSERIPQGINIDTYDTIKQMLPHQKIHSISVHNAQRVT